MPEYLDGFRVLPISSEDAERLTTLRDSLVERCFTAKMLHDLFYKFSAEELQNLLAAFLMMELHIEPQFAYRYSRLFKSRQDGFRFAKAALAGSETLSYFVTGQRTHKLGGPFVRHKVDDSTFFETSEV